MEIFLCLYKKKLGKILTLSVIDREVNFLNAVLFSVG